MRRHTLFAKISATALNMSRGQFPIHGDLMGDIFRRAEAQAEHRYPEHAGEHGNARGLTHFGPGAA